VCTDEANSKLKMQKAKMFEEKAADPAFARNCFRLRSEATAGQVGATRDRRTLPHAGLAQITRPRKAAAADGSRCHTAVSRTRTRRRTIGAKCNVSAKMRGHEMKNAMRCVGTFSTGAGCGWNRNARRKYLIFRQLESFCSIFHPFFTPCFSWKRLIFSRLGKMHAHKRHTIANFGVRISDFKTRIARIITSKTPILTIQACSLLGCPPSVPWHKMYFNIGGSWRLLANGGF
jgi:hypothetical protein